MNPNEQQLRPILSIDLGASYTKLAWRPRWDFEPHLSDQVNRFTSSSKPIAIDGALLVPSLVLDPGEGREWHFGNDAAQFTPGPDACVFRNWKATLFDPSAAPNDITRDTQAATRFFGWLKEKLRGPYPVAEAMVRVCVPELQHASFEIGARRLRTAFEEGGWTLAQWMQVAEPKANVLGLASQGRNHVNLWASSPPIAYLPTIFDSNSPLLIAARHVANGGRPIKLVTIDIGAFTTDIAVCAVASEVVIEQQHSFKHGVALLDQILRNMIRAGGVDADALSHARFEINKRAVYEGSASQWVVGKHSVTLPEHCMDAAIAQFTDDLLQVCRAQTCVAQWFIVTGGGGEIPAILNRIRAKLEEGERGLRYVQDLFRDFDQRIATALGGASVVLDFSESNAKASHASPLPFVTQRSGEPCECGGANKNCAKCEGEGWLRERSSSSKQRVPLPSTEREPAPQGAATASAPIGRNTDTSPPRFASKSARPKSIPGTRSGDAQEPAPPIEASAIIACWRSQEREAKQEFGLEGWIGHLVFGSEIPSPSQKEMLSNHSSSDGRAAWLRLLCMGTCLGVRAKPQYIQKFWQTTLDDVWRVLVPTDLDQLKDAGYETRLDQVFIEAIHRECRDRQATGEDAELWRRVFYDFRKLHHFVYQNDLPASLLDLAAQPRLQADSLVTFLKSGDLPDGSGRWRGAIGQSMTAPLLFILRELRRLDIIDERFDEACFYMNGPARRVARQLRWLSEQESAWFDIESLVEISRTCHDRMKAELPDLLPFFDLSLQWYAFKNPL